MLVEPILDDLDFGGGDGVLAFVNGMGGTPLLELYLMFDEVAGSSRRPGVTVARSLVGNYITSLDMAGCSVTLLQARRRAAPPVGRSGQDAGAAVGRLTVDEHAEVTTMIDAPAVRCLAARRSPRTSRTTATT